jgi:hypothetical protein
VSLGTTSASGVSGKRTYDLVAHLRAQRLRWLGHILRLPQTELLHEIVKHRWGGPEAKALSGVVFACHNKPGPSQGWSRSQSPLRGSPGVSEGK